jgi:hypothetical protein
MLFLAFYGGFAVHPLIFLLVVVLAVVALSAHRGGRLL